MLEGLLYEENVVLEGLLYEENVVLEDVHCAFIVYLCMTIMYM